MLELEEPNGPNGPNGPAGNGGNFPISKTLPASSAMVQSSSPLYLELFSQLTKKIETNNIPAGTILKEATLANMLGISRAPVRRALKMLVKSGKISPAEGQGFIVTSNQKQPPVAGGGVEDIKLDAKIPQIKPQEIAVNIAQSISLDVKACSPFGTYKINEAKACKHFAVGRTVLRDVLGKLETHGLIEKKRQSHWSITPLTARNVRESFELLKLLEPKAFAQSIATMDVNVFKAMRQEILEVQNVFPDVSHQTIEALEDDLHIKLLGNIKNNRLLETIKQNQLPFVIFKIFRRNFGVKSDYYVLEEQAEILDQLIKGSFDVASMMFERHLSKREENALAKLRVLSTLPKPETAPYLINIL